MLKKPFRQSGCILFSTGGGFTCLPQRICSSFLSAAGTGNGVRFRGSAGFCRGLPCFGEDALGFLGSFPQAPAQLHFLTVEIILPFLQAFFPLLQQLLLSDMLLALRGGNTVGCFTCFLEQGGCLPVGAGGHAFCPAELVFILPQCIF